MICTCMRCIAQIISVFDFSHLFGKADKPTCALFISDAGVASLLEWIQAKGEQDTFTLQRYGIGSSKMAQFLPRSSSPVCECWAAQEAQQMGEICTKIEAAVAMLKIGTVD